MAGGGLRANPPQMQNGKIRGSFAICLTEIRFALTYFYMNRRYIASALAVSAVGALFADIAPGTYSGQEITETNFAYPGGNSEWIFEDCNFSSPFRLVWGDTNADSAYHVTYSGTEGVFSEFKLMRGGMNSSSVFEMSGSAENRAVLNGASSLWIFEIDTSKTAGSNASNELRLSGYSDFSVVNFKVASDAGFKSGSAGMTISGAGNSFTATGASYINTNAATADSTNRLFLDLSGVAGAKSSATFADNLDVRAAGGGTTEINVKGNADFTVAGYFRFAMDSSGGSADFNVTGEGNSLNFTKTAGNFFLLGSDLTGGDVSFTIGGRNNSMTVGSNAWIGSKVAGSGKVTFGIEGSGHSVQFNGSFNLRAENGNSATLAFAADADGLSTLNVASLGLFSGDMTVDLSDFVGDRSGVYTVALISADSGWESIAATLEGSSADPSSKVGVIMGEGGLSWDISYADNELQLTYNYTPGVPEPAAWAAIFGAAALALAVRRRRA